MESRLLEYYNVNRLLNEESMPIYSEGGIIKIRLP